MREVRFNLHIPADAIRRYYSGEVQFVQVIDDQGRRIRFASRHLRPFLSYQGVHGRFCLRFDQNNRLIDLRRSPE